MMPMWAVGCGAAAAGSMVPPGAVWMLPASQAQLWAFPTGSQVVNLGTVSAIAGEAVYSGEDVAVEESPSECAAQEVEKRELLLMRESTGEVEKSVEGEAGQQHATQEGRTAV
ncbi:hypothetical protein HPP92_014167 [Vanilla planifolia]|uniref:Uncharacterized protein n=1 Tax=Vanilla planifolia TaxID=51239 RepID=A0A835QNY5_VANPL|nr:hypothetical protein HPP92_014167 [Vanilla planifolia]